MFKKTTVVATPAQLAAAKQRRNERIIFAKFGAGVALVLAAVIVTDKLIDKYDEETLED